MRRAPGSERPRALGEPCSERSRALGEELAGTAPEALRWVLVLERPPPWQPEPIAGLPEALAARVRALLASQPGGRLQLVHRPGPPPATPAAWLAWLPDGELRRLPPEALLAADDVDDLRREGDVEGEPLYLVCVHGRRDACCAAHGVAVERALGSRAPGRVWQTSHIGGHRLAATAVVLPDGVYYGRLAPGDASALAEAHGSRRLGPTSKLRGRAGVPAGRQAAEVFALRARGEVSPLPDRIEELGEGVYALRFGGELVQVEVERRPLAVPLPKSCGDEPLALEAFHRRR